MSAAAVDATKLMNDTCLTAAKGVQDYNDKFIEFAQTNIGAAVAFFEQVRTVKSPSEFFELSTNHSRKQFETFTEQARQLATLGQKAALTTAEEWGKLDFVVHSTIGRGYSLPADAGPAGIAAVLT